MNDGLALVLSKMDALRKNGKGWMTKCPAHPDNKPSLAIQEGDTQPVVLTCHAGCERDAVLQAVGLSWADVCSPRKEQTGEWTPAGEAVAVYDYVDEEGKFLFQVLRTVDKQFRQRMKDPNAKSGWRWSIEGVRRVPYRLPKVIEAVAEGRTIFVVEGERDVWSIEAKGEVATCNPGGAGKWRGEYDKHFAGAHVVIVADKDEPGQRHARQVASHLRTVAASLMVAEAKAGKDTSDHLAAGYELAELEVTSQNGEDPPVDLAPDLEEFLAGETDFDWLIPGLFERADRLILTGPEGFGKSLMCQQMAVCMAAGIHPLRFSRIKPVRVLYIECENGERHLRRALKKLNTTARSSGRGVEKGQMRIICRSEGLDLTTEDDSAWLVERVTAHRPDVLFIGPLYRLHAKNPSDEQPARSVVAALDRARAVNGAALIVEAHAGHGEGGKARSVRPTGSSLFLRWPEFGYGLAPYNKTNERTRSPLAFTAWRGPRDEREWPDRLERGDMWPWEGVWEAGMPNLGEGAA